MGKGRKKHTNSQGLTGTNTGENEVIQKSVSVSGSPCASLSDSCLVANAALSLLNLCCYFLDKQLTAQAIAFEKEGGFTERLYKVRTEKRRYAKKQ